MQNVKKLSRTAAVFLLAVLILICSTVLPNTGTTVSAASAELNIHRPCGARFKGLSRRLAVFLRRLRQL